MVLWETSKLIEIADIIKGKEGKTLEFKRDLSSFDQEPCTELNEDEFDMDKAKSVFKSVNRSIDKHKLESLGLVVPYAGRKTVSNGCIILFGKEIHRNRFFPDARVSCARFRGTDKSQFIQGCFLSSSRDS